MSLVYIDTVSPSRNTLRYDQVMTRPVPIIVLLLAGLLSGCGAARPIPVSRAPSVTALPQPAAIDLSVSHLLELPDELFEHPEGFIYPLESQHGTGDLTSGSDSGEQLLEIARKFVGVPYRNGGASPAGFDCSGLVYYAFRQMGITVPRTSASQHQAAQAVALDELRSGDLLFFKVKPQRVSHVGIFVKDDLFLHAASTGKNVTYSRLGEAYWKKRLVGAGRFETITPSR
jgi:murein DD-endopeptidase